MVRLSLSIILFSLCAALVKVPVSPTISPTVNSKIIDGETRRLGRPPIVTDVTNIRNLQYKIALYVGTPPQYLNVIVDTGSDVLYTQWTWVPDCSYYCHFPNHTFNPMLSTTWCPVESSFSISYNTGHVYGQVGNDTVSFDLVHNVTQHTLIVASSHNNLENLQADGIMGLSFPFDAESPMHVVQRLYLQGLIEAPVFSVFLNNNEFKDKEAKPESALLLGGYELDTYSSSANFTYIPLVAATDPFAIYWSVTMTQIGIGHVTIDLVSKHAIFDTGTSYILAPSFDAYQILAVIKSVNTCTEDLYTYVCTCESESWFEFYPVLVLILGPEQTKVKLNPQDYFYRYEGVCQLLIDSDPELDYWLLGDVFLRKYYILFDLEQRRVGLATSVLSVVVETYTPSWREWMEILVIPVIGAVLFICIYLFIERPCGMHSRIPPI